MTYFGQRRTSKQFKELGFKKKRSYDIYVDGRQAEEKYQHHPPASQKLPGKGRAFSWLRFRDRAKSRFVCESDPHEKYRKLPYDGDVVAALTANDQSAIRHLLKASNSFTHGGCIYGGDLKAAVYANDREAIRRIAKEGRSAPLPPGPSAAAVRWGALLKRVWSSIQRPSALWCFEWCY